ncbi:hypothetical protein [Spirillospora albida]|uniref:hypothetical protein n=1 Tax=Spirillospora albida TaxID=58123 RepID=UPI00068F57D0|nr:hypothetical protein [Spirillospora albida]
MTRRTGRTRTVTGAAGAAIGALVALAGCGEPAPAAPAGPSAPATAPASPTGDSSLTRVTVTVTAGTVRTPRRRVKVRTGTTVEITVTSDTADEFHLHGYDRTLRLTPGRPATLRLDAAIPGVFEAELHHTGTPVLELQVG